MNQRAKALTVIPAAALLLTACGGDDVPQEDLEMMLAWEEGLHTDDVNCEDGLSHQEGETTSCTVDNGVSLDASYEDEEGAHSIRFVGGWGEIWVDLDEWEETRDEVEQEFEDA